MAAEYGGVEASLVIRWATPTIATSGQPTAHALARWARCGTRVIINLGLANAGDVLPDERGTVSRWGMRYIHLPVSFESPTDDDLRRFFATMDEVGDEDVLVHCAKNYRVSVFVALYAESRWGWSRPRADAWITAVWRPNETWTRFLAESRSRLHPTGSALRSQ